MMNSNLKSYLKYEAKLELARRNFWYYCKLLAADFYKENRLYLKDICNKLQDFLTNDKKVLVINMPPRFGKSRTISLYIEWLLGIDKSKKIISCSYNELLSTQFSKTIRNTIQEQKADKDTVVYNDIFPDVHIQKGDGSANLWSVEGGYNNYLATSPNASSTGFGASILLLDDIIKSAEEAHNELTKEKHWEWFTSTLLSRLEQGGKIICIMTRWSNTDISARLLKSFKQEQVEHIIYKAKENKMLCNEILSEEEYIEKQKLIPPDIFLANYLQEPIELKGQLYQEFKIYTELPEISEVFSYCDTADTGADFLCNIIFTYYMKEIYILDVVYTKAPMEETENKVAQAYYENKVNRARIESNNGGRGFARNVQRILLEKYKSNYTQVTTFSQTKNKQARILTASSWIEQHVYFPQDWHIRWEQFYKDITNYQREGKNLHDDAPDALTGCVETIRTIYHI
jgi:predicted phage terminase large subunit-like protein